jgi:carboxyl-terminal processing protease
MHRMIPVRQKFHRIGAAYQAQRFLSRSLPVLLAGMLLLPVRAPLAAEPPAIGNAVLDFVEVFNQVKAQYAEPLDDQKLVNDAIRSVVRQLDPYSEYLDAATYRQMQLEAKGQFGGLGIEVAKDNGGVKIIAAYEGAPAHQAGLRPGDRIVRIDDTAADTLTLEQAIQRARGEPGTQVKITVLHEGGSEPEIIQITRGIIERRTVKSELLAEEYAYIRVHHFNHATTPNVIAGLSELSARTPEGLKGLVLDLRDNPGGVLKAAVAMATLFLPEDALVVYTEGAGEASRMRYSASATRYLKANEEQAKLLATLKELPIVVLVNGGSASASEILAGALQDYHRATIAGTRSFGKGTVQALVPLKSGAALKITTAYYHTPHGRKIHGVGLVPDVLVASQTATAGEPSGFSSTGDGGQLPAGTCLQLPAQPGTAAGPEGDCQVQRALELLRGKALVAGR